MPIKSGMTRKIMILKKIEIAGFKSFGKKVTLEFSSPVTAIVGPNGSGKSNVSEAIRWVLGEQSMKSLRGKHGEDLIFHGSDSSSQLGKARVSITFDNGAQVFPVDFSEIVISREVYRDGANEYRLNDSLVRLKDIIELMSNVGVGGSGHHIISQGEADRILYASLRDRKHMIEDALGLRIFYLKRLEAERKLAETRENMREVGMLRREIQPHMRFLKDQAAKVEASAKIHEELQAAFQEYMAREGVTLRQLEEKFQQRKKPLEESYKAVMQEVEHLRAALLKAEKQSDAEKPKELSEHTQKLEQLDKERQELAWEAGRLEGELSVLQRTHENTTAENSQTLLKADVEREFQAFLQLVERAFALDSLDAIHGVLAELRASVERFLAAIRHEYRGVEKDAELTALRARQSNLAEKLELIVSEREDVVSKIT
ncbi:MAG: AAA family ATPase, partial [Patescibacteria group bacterium]